MHQCNLDEQGTGCAIWTVDLPARRSLEADGGPTRHRNNGRCTYVPAVLATRQQPHPRGPHTAAETQHV